MNQRIPTADFPAHDSLCEHCGYPLQELPATGNCPECGTPIVESNPAHRTGLPWQNRMSFANWIATVVLVMLNPDRAFRLMRVGGDNAADRNYLLTHAVVAAIAWLAGSFAIGERRGIIDCLWVALAVIAMTMIEALGVTYFSWRRGWRVPWRLAERIACYASPGWLPAVIVFGVFTYLERTGVFRPWLGRFDLTATLIAYVVLLGVSMLGFETLVWVGVRRTRFANAAVP